MKIRLFVAGAACALQLCSQHHHFSWQDACFNNPSAPYCNGHDTAVKRKGDGKKGAPGKPGEYSEAGTGSDSFTDSGGVDWRFADPAGESVAVLNCSGLAASPVASSVIRQLGANQDIGQAEIEKIFRGLSSLKQVALSVHKEDVLLMVTGRAQDSVLPAMPPGWKALPLAGGSVLMGNGGAVDQAARRMLVEEPLADLAEAAQERQTDTEFWAAWPDTTGKHVILTAIMREHLVSDTASGDSSVAAGVVHTNWSMEPDQLQTSFGKVVASPLGQRLGELIKCSRYLPVRDTAGTVHTKPVIYGLEEGSKEVSQYVPAPAESIAQVVVPAAVAPATTTAPKGEHLSFPPPRNTWKWTIQSVAVPSGAGVKYSSFYYEAATDRSVEKPLSLPNGGAIVGVFPDNCTFSVRNDRGVSFTFGGESEAKAKGLGPGAWSVYPVKCGGVAVFVK